MDNNQPVLRERFIFIALLVLVAAVLIFAPLYYGFIYPTGGDDTAFHIRNLNNLTSDFGYIGSLSYYGLVILTPFTFLGLDPIIVFSIFNYAVIAAVFVSMWILLRRFYGLLCAALGFYVSVFIVMGTWYYFDDGTIFNVFNLWVVAVPAYYALCLWLEKGKPKWLIITGILFILTSLIHSASYLFIMASMLLFTAGYSLFQWKAHNSTMLRRILSFGAVFSLSILSAWVTWMHELLPSQVSAMVGTITGEQSSYAARVTPFHWVEHYLNTGTALLLAVAIIIIVIILFKGRGEDKNEVIAKLNQPLSYIFLSFIVVLSIGAFTLLGYNYDRFARDLATFTGLGTAILLGLGIARYQLKYKKIWIIIISSLLVITNLPLHNWLGDYTALRSCDRQAIDYLNEISTEPVVVQHFSKLAPWIYELYTNETIDYDRAYDLTEYADADIIIYRNNHMTYSTENTTADNIQITDDILEEQENLMKLARFRSGVDEIIIYKIDK